ncbi:MAG: NlpC/P60 family protein [Stackebrandtia sp.]
MTSSSVSTTSSVIATASPRATGHRLVLAILAGTLAVALSPSPAAAEPSVKQLEKRVDDASAELEVIVEDYNELNEELADLEGRHDLTGESLKPLRGEAERSAAEVGDIAASVYQAGPAVSVTPIISGPPETLIERLSVLEFISQEQGDAVEDLVTVTRTLESEELRIDELTSERDRLTSQKSEKRKAINRDQARLRELRTTATGQGYRDNPGLKPPPVSSEDTGAAATAVRFAHDQLGKPYQWGGAGPEGFDCSGLTMAAWDAAGVGLPHSAEGQHRAVPHVGRDELRPGDLVFYYPDIHHVALYVGQGKIIHAPNEGQDVRVSGIDEAPVSGFGRPM